MSTRWVVGVALAALASAGTAGADDVRVKFVNVPPGVTQAQLAFSAANGSKPLQPMSLADQVAQAVLNMTKPADGSPQRMTLYVQRCRKTGQVNATLVAEGGQAPRDCEREGQQRDPNDDCECTAIAILWDGGDITVDLTAMQQVVALETERALRRFTAAVALLSGVSQLLHDEDVCLGGLSELRQAGFNANCSSDNQRLSGGGLLRAQITNLASGGMNAARAHGVFARSAVGSSTSPATWALDLGVEAGFLPLAGKLTLDTTGQNGQFSITTDGFYETRAGFVVLAPQLRIGNRIALVLRGGPAYWRSDSGSSGRFLRGQTVLDQFQNDQENSGLSFMYGGDLLIRLSEKVSIGPSFVAMHQKDGEGDNAVDTRVRQFNAMVRITP